MESNNTRRHATEDQAHEYMKRQNRKGGEFVVVADEDGLERITMTMRAAIAADFLYTCAR